MAAERKAFSAPLPSDTPLFDLMNMYLTASEAKEEIQEAKSRLPVLPASLRKRQAYDAVINRMLNNKPLDEKEKKDILSLAKALEKKIEEKNPAISAEHHFILGLIYLDLKLIPDRQLFLAYSTKAAAENNLVANFNLGRLHEEKHDNKKAYEYYKQAADRNFPNALMKLAWAYKNGIGTAINYDKAAFYYRKAILKGYRGADLDKFLLVKRDLKDPFLRFDSPIAQYHIAMQTGDLSVLNQVNQKNVVSLLKADLASPDRELRQQAYERFTSWIPTFFSGPSASLKKAIDKKLKAVKGEIENQSPFMLRRFKALEAKKADTRSALWACKVAIHPDTAPSIRQNMKAHLEKLTQQKSLKAVAEFYLDVIEKREMILRATTNTNEAIIFAFDNAALPDAHKQTIKRYIMEAMTAESLNWNVIERQYAAAHGLNYDEINTWYKAAIIARAEKEKQREVKQQSHIAVPIASAPSFEGKEALNPAYTASLADCRQLVIMNEANNINPIYAVDQLLADYRQKRQEDRTLLCLYIRVCYAQNQDPIRYPTYLKELKQKIADPALEKLREDLISSLKMKIPGAVESDPLTSAFQYFKTQIDEKGPRMKRFSTSLERLQQSISRMITEDCRATKQKTEQRLADLECQDLNLDPDDWYLVPQEPVPQYEPLVEPQYEPLAEPEPQYQPLREDEMNPAPHAAVAVKKEEKAPEKQIHVLQSLPQDKLKAFTKLMFDSSDRTKEYCDAASQLADHYKIKGQKGRTLFCSYLALEATPSPSRHLDNLMQGAQLAGFGAMAAHYWDVLQVNAGQYHTINRITAIFLRFKLFSANIGESVIKKDFDRLMISLTSFCRDAGFTASETQNMIAKKQAEAEKIFEQRQKEEHDYKAQQEVRRKAELAREQQRQQAERERAALSPEALAKREYERLIEHAKQDIQHHESHPRENRFEYNTVDTQRMKYNPEECKAVQTIRNQILKEREEKRKKEHEEALAKQKEDAREKEQEKKQFKAPASDEPLPAPVSTPAPPPVSAQSPLFFQSSASHAAATEIARAVAEAKAKADAEAQAAQASEQPSPPESKQTKKKIVMGRGNPS